MGKAKYVEWREPDKLLLIYGWKRNGLTNEEIAKNIGISRKTLQEWAVRFGDIGDALKKGKEYTNFAVESKLLSKAMSGNLTAIIFWLKNNWREKYNDKQLTPEECELINEQIKAAKLENKRKELELQNLSDIDNRQVIFLNEDNIEN